VYINGVFAGLYGMVEDIGSNTIKVGRGANIAYMIYRLAYGCGGGAAAFAYLIIKLLLQLPMPFIQHERTA
jgi:hypothetical protein